MSAKPPSETAVVIAPDFEQSLSELETLIARLERGDLPLADSLALFEQGIALTRHCHTHLTDARQRVEILLKDGARPFDADALDGDE